MILLPTYFNHIQPLPLLESRETVLIDPVLDYDPFSGTVKADSGKQLIDFVEKNKLNVTRIIDTHVHAVC